MARVLIVGRGAPERGGIRTAMESLLGSPLARRHELTYLNLGRERGTAGGRPSVANLVRTLTDLRAMWRQAEGQDIVHVHSAFAPTVTVARAGALCLVGRLRGATSILHLHGGRFPGWVDGRIPGLLVRLIAAWVDRFAVVSQRSADALSDVIGPAKVEMIPNGVDTDRFRPGVVEPGSPVVLYVGVLSPRKGLLDLFEASRRLRAGGVEHRLWLAGGIPDEGTEASDTVGGAAPEWAEFLGEVGASLPGVYGSSTIFCLPSWWEAAPLTVMEAAASGLAVVATRVGDVPNMVDDGETGLLVEPQDVDALAAALAKLVESPVLCREMGTRARERAESLFSLTTSVAAIDHLYQVME